MNHKILGSGTESSSFSLVCACVYTEASFWFGPQVLSILVLFEAESLTSLGLSSQEQLDLAGTSLVLRLHLSATMSPGFLCGFWETPFMCSRQALYWLSPTPPSPYFSFLIFVWIFFYNDLALLVQLKIS